MKLSEERVKLENRLTKLSGTSAIVGRESVQKVLETFEQRASDSEEEEIRLRPIIDGYMGQVIDCFAFDANLAKAIEVTTKSKLFYHIVTTDRIGTKILKEVNRQKMFGDITFIPLNKLNLKSVRYPDMGVSLLLIAGVGNRRCALYARCQRKIGKISFFKTL